MNGRPSKIPGVSPKVKAFLQFFGILAGIIIAAIPGWQDRIQNKSGKAHEKAEKSHEAAVEAKTQTDVAYELLKQRMEFFEKQFAKEMQDNKEFKMMVLKLLIEKEPAPHARRRVSRASPLASLGLGGGGGISTPTMAAPSKEDLMEALVEESNEPPVQEQIKQEPLPMLLDTLTQKRMKSKEDKRAKLAEFAE